MKLFNGNKVFNQFEFDKESDFEKEVVKNSKYFFGSNSIYIDAKRKIESKNLGNSIPDGFLFDLSDKENPEFYLVEVELAKHDFYNHIFPQITKFFGFFKNPNNQNDLIEKIFLIINSDFELKKEFKKYLGDQEVYKFIKDTLERSQNILLIIDGEKKELPEIMETYSDTWGKIVRLVLLKKFVNNSEEIYSMHPDFENIEFGDIQNETSPDSFETDYNEEYHLEGVSESVRKIYNELREDLKNFDPKLIFNPKKYYISVRKEKNLFYFIPSRKKIRLVVLESEQTIKNEVSNYSVKSLTASVQRFWNGNGPSCTVIIESSEFLDEIKSLLRKQVSKT